MIKNSMQAKTYNQDGKEIGAITLSERVFDAPWNADLVNQVVLSLQSSSRTPYAHTKGRGEVAGGGKKPWKQKGTGRARHGSIRSPIWKGGGVAHGPTKDKDFSRKVNKKMKTKALFAILSQKLREGEVLFVDKIALDDRKTKLAQSVINNLSKVEGFERIAFKSGRRAMISLPESNEMVVKSFRNIPQVAVAQVSELNPVEVLRYKYLIITNPEESLKKVENKLKA